MPIEDAFRYIDRAAEVGSMEWVSFTGGEPFLLREMLQKLIWRATERGLKTEIVTNCYWAGSVDTAREELLSLKEAGLDVINISTDDFHQRQIPFGLVKNCYEAARAIDLKVVFMMALSRESRLDLDALSMLLDAKIAGPGRPAFKKPDAVGFEGGFVPVGRGAFLPESSWVSEPIRDGACLRILRDIGVDPEGEVLVCCGAAAMPPRGRIGNLNKGRLEEIVLEAYKEEIFRRIATEGPRKMAEKKGLDVQSFANKCHLCHSLLSLDP